MPDKISRPVEWIGSSYKDFVAFPDPVQDDIGFALYEAQIGRTSRAAKPLKGFGGAGVIEIVESHEGDTYRAVYTVKFESAVYVLHAFQKKSKRGIATPQRDIELVKLRLKAAEADHNARSRGKA
ncbi:MAG: type II toxin-antitoxin system RelE/ParE family toxin [Rhizomicrobium sp.]